MGTTGLDSLGADSDSALQAAGQMWPYLPVSFFKNRNNYFKMNSFNEFLKGTCILLDLLFLKHTKKKKKRKKKAWYLSDFLSTVLPSKQTTCPLLPQLGAADPTQNLFPTG